MREIEMMKEAYEMLFELENKLRRIVVTNLLKHYGQTWLMKRYSTRTYFHEIIAFFGKYPIQLPHFNQRQLKKLRDLNPIRNKIAHSELLSDEEFEHLKKCYRFVMKAPMSKRKIINSNV